MTLELAELHGGLEDAYESFLGGLDGSLLWYTLRYKTFLQELLDCEARYLVTLEGSDVTGVLPIMFSDGQFGRIVNSLPFFGSHGGILGQTEAARRALADAYRDVVGEADVAAATVVGNPFVDPAAPEPPHDVIDERIAQSTPLEPALRDPSRLMAIIDGASRRNVRKAQSAGVTVAVENGRLDVVEVLHHEGMAAIGGRPKPKAFFALLPRHFRAGEDYRVYVARHCGEPVAALLVFCFGQTVEYFIPCTRLAARELQPSALILLHAMAEAAGNGFSLWNWGGTHLDQTGVYRFKRKWGAVDGRYRYYTAIMDRGLLRESPESLSGSYPYFFVIPFRCLETAS